MGVENMTYKSPIHTLIESLFRSYPYMDLSQRLMVIGALARSLYPGIEEQLKISIADVIAEARELEVLINIHVEMYKQGEIENLLIPDKLKKLYEIENKLLSRIFGFYIRVDNKQGVDKYV